MGPGTPFLGSRDPIPGYPGPETQDSGSRTRNPGFPGHMGQETQVSGVSWGTWPGTQETQVSGVPGYLARYPGNPEIRVPRYPEFGVPGDPIYGSIFMFPGYPGNTKIGVHGTPKSTPTWGTFWGHS